MSPRSCSAKPSPFAAAVSLLFIGAGCDDSSGALPSSGDVGPGVANLRLVPIATGARAPTFLTELPGSGVLLVLEQAGVVRRIENGELAPEPFLDLSDRVVSRGEQGLLGMAFHPSFAENGRFFVHYSSVAVSGAQIADGDGVISEFVRTASALTVDVASERRLLSVSQPYSNHNGGMLAFSPADGFLYIGLGDGGAGGDPHGNGQNLGTWLGKMLRIDVDARDRDGVDSITSFGVDGAGEMYVLSASNGTAYRIDGAEFAPPRCFPHSRVKNRW